MLYGVAERRRYDATAQCSFQLLAGTCFGFLLVSCSDRVAMVAALDELLTSLQDSGRCYYAIPGFAAVDPPVHTGLVS